MSAADDLPEQDVYPWKDSYDSAGGADPYAWWLAHLGARGRESAHGPDADTPES